MLKLLWRCRGRVIVSRHHWLKRLRTGMVHGGWIQMKKALLIFLFTISPAFADDQNIYDFFRQLPNSESAIVDEQTTALIKRHMATLLYPVDMGSFARPEKDAKFREQVIALQKQFGRLP